MELWFCINESVLAVEYTFSYISGSGMANRKFTVSMIEGTIAELIKALDENLAISVFTKEKRASMTSKLRELIKKRGNFACCSKSIHIEPNLHFEVDYVKPASKGGCPVEENIQK